jgi:hypothetical protein
MGMYSNVYGDNQYYQQTLDEHCSSGVDDRQVVTNDVRTPYGTERTIDSVTTNGVDTTHVQTYRAQRPGQFEGGTNVTTPNMNAGRSWGITFYPGY